MPTDSAIERYSPSLAAYLAQGLAARTEPIEITLSGYPARLTLKSLPRGSAAPLLNFRANVTVDGEQAHLFIPPALFDYCLEGFVEGLARAELSPSNAGLVLEAAVAAHLDRLEDALGARIEVHDVELCRDVKPEWRNPNLQIKIELPGVKTFTVQACCSVTLERRLLAAWSARESDDPALDPPVAIAIRIGRTVLSPAEAAMLDVDDVVVIEDSPLLTKQVCLVVDEAIGARGNLNGRALSLVEPLSPLAGSWLERYGTRAASALDAQPAGAGRAAIMVVDLARRMLPASQLSKVNLDETIELPAGIEDVVDVAIEGVLSGKGRIVRVGPMLGVRILGVTRHG